MRLASRKSIKPNNVDLQSLDFDPASQQREAGSKERLGEASHLTGLGESPDHNLSVYLQS